MATQTQVDPRVLRPNPWNSNVVNPENQKKLEESIRRLGFNGVVLVRELDDGSLEILGGAHRVKAAISIGLAKVPVLNLGVVADLKAKEIGLVDNARYGSDDTISLAKILDEIDAAALPNFMPISGQDIDIILNAVNVSLDELEIGDDDEKEQPETPAQRVQRTHDVMRFKVPIGDAERIRELISKTQKTHGFSGSDDMTNAGDALVHLLFSVKADS